MQADVAVKNGELLCISGTERIGYPILSIIFLSASRATSVVRCHRQFWPNTCLDQTLGKDTRDKILAKNRLKQPILNALAYTNLQTASSALAIVTFLSDHYGHWIMENGLCVFETQEKVDAYNELNEKLQSSLVEAEKLERSFFEK